MMVKIKERVLTRRFDPASPSDIYNFFDVEFDFLPREGERIRINACSYAMKVIGITHVQGQPVQILTYQEE